MDYVVFGIGFGATILVLGLLVRDIGPRLRYRKPAGDDGIFHAEELVAKVSWGRFCGALGAVLAIGGMLFLVTTVICMVLRLSDETGGWVMIGSLAFIVLLLAFWTWAFFDRFGSYGILPEREEEQVVAAPPARVERPSVSERRPAAREAVTASEGGTPADADASTEEPAAEKPAGDESTEEQADTSEEEMETSTDEATDTEPRENGETPLATPEERLAQMESPIDHGSAEGDLDIAAGGPRRPAPRPRRVPARPQQPRSAADPARSPDSDQRNARDSDTAVESDQKPDRETT
ncbi:MAG TPA: hypothetical protein VD789_12700 [Thermomicrobiales bacterium]|nr:hypothetical protein [Thermomicrobiales bacterium]